MRNHLNPAASVAAIGTAMAAGCLTYILSSTSALAADSPAPAAAEPGVWQKHEYSFAFLGFTSTYSCDGLADKLKLLLLASGARADAKARPGACASDFGRPDKFARADLTFYTLSAPRGDTPGTVSGVWRPIVLADRKPFDLGVGDCELVEQFRSNVLSLFTVRNENNHTTCIPHQDSGSLIDLKFDSFTAAPVKPAARPAAPSAPTQSAP